MNRLTTNKEVSEMSMYELAHNMFFAKDREAMYKDYDREISCRDLTRELIKKYKLEGIFSSAFFTDDETFDEEIIYALSYETDSLEGLIALLYMAMWGSADLRETLKQYEDAGITPEQIKEIDKLYQEKCKALNTLQEASQALCEQQREYQKLGTVEELKSMLQQCKDDDTVERIKNRIQNIGYLPVCVDCCTKHQILEIIEEEEIRR